MHRQLRPSRFSNAHLTAVKDPVVQKFPSLQFLNRLLLHAVKRGLSTSCDFLSLEVVDVPACFVDNFTVRRTALHAFELAMPSGLAFHIRI